MEGSVTVIPDSLFNIKGCFANKPPADILWNSWQYKLLKKIADGIYNAEVIWCYNEKYGKVGKSLFHKCVLDFYGCEKYHRDIRFTGRMLDELNDKNETVKAIILELPYNIDMECRVHCNDALKDIEEYIYKLIPTKTKHPVIIVLAPRRAEKVLGVDLDVNFELLCLREISLPIFSDSLPADELIHLYFMNSD